MPHASSLETKEQILDVAENAIALNGYAGTTLRSVVGKANVNLAAIHYHFGSKEDLFRAVVARISEPIVSGQLAALDELIASGSSPTVEEILRAYLRPSLSAAMMTRTANPMRAHFISRCRTEPEPVQSIASEQFQPGSERFLDALQRALPDQSRSQLAWKLDLVVTFLLRTLAQAGKPNALLAGHSEAELESAISKLIAFLLPGMENG